MKLPEDLPSRTPLHPPLVGAGAWSGHLPFAYDLVWALQPTHIVELGVDRGESLLAFSHAAQLYSLETSILGVDSWKGDTHAGSSSIHLMESVLSDLDALDFPGTRIARSYFAQALGDEKDGSIDLLHIDGLHTYEAVMRDWNDAHAKLSDRAVVLFHDTQVVGGEFGVHRAFEEIVGDGEQVTFNHFFGLGVLRIGTAQGERFEHFWDWLRNNFSQADQHYREAFEGMATLPNADQARLRHTAGVAEPFDTPSAERLNIPVDAVPVPFKRPGNPLAPAYEATKNLAPATGSMFTILMPIHEPEIGWLEEAIDSVMQQTISTWELILIDDGNAPEIASVLTELCQQDERLKLLRNTTNLHIAGALNRGMSIANGDWVFVLDQDDRIYPDALELLLCYMREYPDAQLIYSDEEKMDASGEERFEPYHKPGFQPELLGTQNYFNHITCYRRELVSSIGGYPKHIPGCHDWGLALKASRAVYADNVIHLPYTLYQWRSHERSTAETVEAKPYVLDSAKKCAQEYWGNQWDVSLSEAGYIQLIFCETKEASQLQWNPGERIVTLRKEADSFNSEYCYIWPNNDSLDSAVVNQLSGFASLNEIACAVPYLVRNGNFIDNAYAFDASGQLRPVHDSEEIAANGYFHHRRLPINPDAIELSYAVFQRERLLALLERIDGELNHGSLVAAMRELWLRPILVPIQIETTSEIQRLPMGNLSDKTFSRKHPRSPQRMDRPFTGLRSQRHK